MIDPTVRLFRAQRVITMVSEDVEGFAAFGERIAAVGSLDQLRQQFPSAEVIDLPGVVVPGFNDAHIHPAMAAEEMLHVDASSAAVSSLEEIMRKLAERATTTPPGGWIRAVRYDDAKMAEGRTLTRGDLDEVSLDHPIAVTHVAGHWGVVNSKALALGGIDETTSPPPGGEHGRGGAGRLNGILYEQAWFNYGEPALASRPSVMPPSGTEERGEALARMIVMLNAAGITSVGDACAGPRHVELYQEAERRGQLNVRVNLLVAYPHFDAIRRLGLRTGFGGSHLRLNGVKGFVDGAIGGRTALLAEPYEDRDDSGMQTMSDGDLRDLVRSTHEAGLRIGIHANGDRAIALLLDQYEAVQEADPRPDMHHRVEHCTVVNEEILARMARLGAIAVPFGSYIHYHGSKLLDWYGAERLEWMFAHRSFLDAGVAVAGSSDYSCGPFEPLLAMQSCVTRQGFDGALLGPSQRIAPLEALGLYTTGSAYASGEQDVKGRLAPGHLADFVVLGANPLTTPLERLAAIPILATYVGGRQVWPAC
jgi:predicted amidohydrolase YtcJ